MTFFPLSKVKPYARAYFCHVQDKWAVWLHREQFQLTRKDQFQYHSLVLSMSGSWSPLPELIWAQEPSLKDTAQAGFSPFLPTPSEQKGRTGSLISSGVWSEPKCYQKPHAPSTMTEVCRGWGGSLREKQAWQHLIQMNAHCTEPEDPWEHVERERRALGSASIF